MLRQASAALVAVATAAAAAAAAALSSWDDTVAKKAPAPAPAQTAAAAAASAQQAACAAETVAAAAAPPVAVLMVAACAPTTRALLPADMVEITPEQRERAARNRKAALFKRAEHLRRLVPLPPLSNGGGGGGLGAVLRPGGPSEAWLGQAGVHSEASLPLPEGATNGPAAAPPRADVFCPVVGGGSRRGSGLPACWCGRRRRLRWLRRRGGENVQLDH